MDSVAHIVDVVLESSCRWWTIELEDYEEALSARLLLEEQMLTLYKNFSYSFLKPAVSQCKKLITYSISLFNIMRDHYYRIILFQRDNKLLYF